MWTSYNTSSEDAWNDLTAGRQRLISFLENNCGLLTPAANINSWPVLNPINSDGYAYIRNEDRISLPNYSTMRHDYT